MSHHTWNDGATDDEIFEAEDSLGRTLPRVFRAMYEMSNGLHLVGGDLQFVGLKPSDESEFSLVNLSSKLRDWGWLVPEELLVFGGNGGGEHFGVWLPEGKPRSEDCPVIMVGETDTLAIAGTNLCSFLKGRTAYYLLLGEADRQALDTLGLPSDLYTSDLMDLDDDAFARITKWADPYIRDPLPDPYQRGITVDELRSYPWP